MQWVFEPAGWLTFAILSIMLLALGLEQMIRVGEIGADLSSPDQRRNMSFSLGLACVLFLLMLLVAQWFKSWPIVFGTLGDQAVTTGHVLLVLAGLFLLVKATVDLSERRQGDRSDESLAQRDRLPWQAPIGRLTLVFALSAVALVHALAMTAGLMLAAFVLAASLLVMARRALLGLVRRYPSVMVLSRSYLLLIGAFALLQAVGAATLVPYLQVVLLLVISLGLVCGFVLGQRLEPEMATGLRERTLEAVLRVLDERARPDSGASHVEPGSGEQSTAVGLEQLHMMSGVLTLADRSVHSIMTPRTEVSWIDIGDDANHIRSQIERAPHSFFPVCRGELDEIIGIGRAKRLIADLLTYGRIQESRLRAPLVVHDTISIIRLIDTLKQSRGQLVLVADEFGAIEGLVTPIDVFEAIAGEFPDEDESPDILPDGENRWRVDGAADLHLLEQVLGVQGLTHEQEDYSTLAGYLLSHFGRLPQVGEQCEFQADTALVRFQVMRLERRRIAMVHVEVIRQDAPQSMEQWD